MIDIIIRWCRKAPPMMYRLVFTRYFGNRISGLAFPLALLSIIVGSVMLMVSSGPPPPDLVAWEPDYEKALARAQREDKPVLVYSFWSGGGLYVGEGTWMQVRNNYFTNAKFASLLNESFVCFKEDKGTTRGPYISESPTGLFPDGFTVYAPWGERIGTISMGRGGIDMSPQEFYDTQLLPLFERCKKMSEGRRRFLPPGS